MDEITFSTDRGNLTLEENFETARMVEEFFGMSQDPAQIPATDENIRWMNKNIPDCINVIKSENKLIGETFIIPCNQEIMNDFLTDKINENALFQRVKKEVTYDNFDSIYLCSATIYPEFRKQGLAVEACVKSIKKICAARNLKPILFFDGWSNEGSNLAHKVARLLGLKIKEKAQIYMKSKKVIIFDLDGVLFDSVNLMNDYSISAYPELTIKEATDLHRENIHEAISKLEKKPKEESDTEKLEREKLYVERKMSTPMYVGMKELVGRLSQEYTLVINTSAMRNNSVPLLEREGIANHFSYFGTKEVHPMKVEKFKMIAQEFGQEMSQMLFITDTLGDVEEAKIVNLPTIAVTWGMHSREYFTEEPHANLVAIVENTEELEETIKRLV